LNAQRSSSSDHSISNFFFAIFGPPLLMGYGFRIPKTKNLPKGRFRIPVALPRLMVP
jgi:hypothetical protein